MTAIGGDSGDGIGKGYAYSGPTITLGTVTIYDDIDMVDASSIKDFASVVYMHGETNVTASKTDYFFIREDDDHKIIMPPHTHSFTYSATGATITATCNDDCPLADHKATLTINKPTLTTYRWTAERNRRTDAGRCGAAYSGQWSVELGGKHDHNTG